MRLSSNWQDIDNLVSLSQPELEGKSREKAAIKHFLYAINPDLAIRIKCQYPKHLIKQCKNALRWRLGNKKGRIHVRPWGLLMNPPACQKHHPYKDDVESEKNRSGKING